MDHGRRSSSVEKMRGIQNPYLSCKILVSAHTLWLRADLARRQLEPLLQYSFYRDFAEVHLNTILPILSRGFCADDRR